MAKLRGPEMVGWTLVAYEVWGFWFIWQLLLYYRLRFMAARPLPFLCFAKEKEAKERRPRLQVRRTAELPSRRMILAAGSNSPLGKRLKQASLSLCQNPALFGCASGLGLGSLQVSENFKMHAGSLSFMKGRLNARLIR